jgi:hypothetical protein
MATTLTLDQMKKFVRDHFEDFVNQRKAAVIRTNMTPNFYDHDGPGGKPTGVDGDEHDDRYVQSMPDLHLTIEDMIAEGDKVMCRNVWRWTDPFRQEDAVPRLRTLALRSRQGRRTLATVTPPSLSD